MTIESKTKPEITSKKEKPKPGKPESGIELRQNKPHWQWRREFVERLIGTGDRAFLDKAVKHALRQKNRMQPTERASIDPQTKMKNAYDIVDGPSDVIKIKPAKAHAERVSFGGVGEFMHVTAKCAFQAATVRLKLDAKKIGHLDASSILMTRYDEQEGRFRVIPQSGFNEQYGYVYARITRPGIYSAVGIPLDPRIRTSLQLVRSMSGWKEMEGKFGFNEKICQVILCNPEFNDYINDIIQSNQTIGEMGFEPQSFTNNFNGGNLCDMCLGMDNFDGLIDVIDVLDPPLHVIIDWKFPIKWPRPCRSWASKGPDNVPGRMSAMAVHPTNSNIIYAGGAAGGVYKSTNGGSNWYPRWTNQLSLAIGGLAVAPSNGNILYAATGEWENNVGAANNHFSGVGVYRSTDGGTDWDLMAPIPSQNTAAVAVDPANPNRVFVAGDTSLHRSTDGGMTWDVTLGNVNGVFDGVISDVVIDPNNSNRVYIGVHNSGVWRSTDGSNSWTQLTTGIATGAAASSPKIALGRNGTNGTQFVAVKMARRVFTSSNGGTNFTEQSNCDINWSPFYPWANVIAVDPQDENILFGGHASIYRSTDGGSNWTQVGGYGMAPVHPDQQAMVFDPNDHDHVYLATDGGIFESTDNGQTWSTKSNGLFTTQCWTLGLSQTATLAYGITTQDNACYKWNSSNNFSQILGPEGGWIEYDPTDANVIYADTWFSNLKKSTDGGATWSNLAINTDSGHRESLSIAHTNSDWLLAVKNNGRVARSTDGGNTWNETLTPAGTSISAVQFAPSSDNHAYAASQNGRVWHSTDGGANWTELPNVDLPAVATHDIEVDWNDPLRVYIGFGAIGTRQIWRGEVDVANNATWFDISGALPAVSLPDLACTGLALDPTYEETIYASNILGVYRTTDGGESWVPFDNGLPNSFVSDLDLRKRDRSLWVSTMGRGIYRRKL